MSAIAFTIHGLDGDVLRALEAQAPETPHDPRLTPLFGVIETAIGGALSWYDKGSTFDVHVDGTVEDVHGRTVYTLAIQLNAVTPVEPIAMAA